MASVYFIRCKTTGLVKIGFSDNPWSRLSKIQSDNPGELEMLSIVPLGRDFEAAVHRMFEKEHVRGEWFTHSPALAAYIGTLPAVIKPKRSHYTIDGTVLGDIDFAATVGVAKSYAAQLRGGLRPITIAIALTLHEKTGERIGPLLNATDTEIEILTRFHRAPEFYSDRCRAGTPAVHRPRSAKAA